MLRVLVTLLAAIWATCLTAAQQPDLTSLSLEEFLKVEVVSVRKSLQSVSRTAAAVYVITQEDIRRSGAKNLPDALRLAPGVHVARVNGSLWAVGIRGANSFFSRNLLVMIDGRTIYNPIMSGVIWSQQMTMLEDVERIEVIRGPAGSMWGANAVNGVINIITKKASDTQGTLLAGSADTFDPGRISVRHGGRSGEKLAWRTWFQHNINGQAEMPAGWPALNAWQSTFGGVRADWSPSDANEVMVQGMVKNDDRDVHAITFPAPMRSELTRRNADGKSGFLLARWEHRDRKGHESVLQLHEDVQSIGMGVVELNSNTFDVDFQRSIVTRGGHALLAGGGFRANQIRTEGSADAWFEPANRTYLVSNAFLQDEWQIRPDRLVLTLGAKLERYTVVGESLQPSVRAIWTPTRRQAYWASVSGAVRTPAHYDFAIRYPLRSFAGQPLPFTVMVSGNPDLKPEKLRAVDVGARWQAWRKAALEVAGFHYRYLGANAYHSAIPLGGQAIPPPGGIPPGMAGLVIPYVAANNFDGLNRGGEVTLHYDPRPNLRFSNSYSAVFMVQSLRKGYSASTDFATPYFSPKHQVQLRTSWDAPRHWSLDGSLSRLSGIRSTITTLSRFTRVDLRVARSFGESSEVYLSGQNLLYPRRQEFISDSLYPAGEISRSVQVGFSRRF